MGGCIGTIVGWIMLLVLLGITAELCIWLISAVSSVFALLALIVGAVVAFKIVSAVLSGIGGVASTAAEKAPSVFGAVWTGLYRLSGAAPETRVAKLLEPFRVDGEAELIGDETAWALEVISRAAAEESGTSEPLDLPGKSPIHNRLLEAILVKDVFILRLKKKGALDRGQEVILGCTRAINSLVTMYEDMRPLLDSLRNKKSTLARIRTKMSRYEEQLLEETDPDVIKSVKGAIRSCLETIELLKENRKRAKLFAIKIETATTKLENIMQNSLDSGVADDESLLGELDRLSEDVAAGKSDLREALAELGSLGLEDDPAESAKQRRVEEAEAAEEEFY